MKKTINLLAIASMIIIGTSCGATKNISQSIKNNNHRFVQAARFNQNRDVTKCPSIVRNNRIERSQVFNYGM